MRLEPSCSFDCVCLLKLDEVTDFILIFLTETLIILSTLWAISFRFLLFLYQCKVPTSPQILHCLCLVLRYLHPLR